MKTIIQSAFPFIGTLCMVALIFTAMAFRNPFPEASQDKAAIPRDTVPGSQLNINIDIQKIQMEIQQSLKKIDFEKMQKDIDASLKKIDWNSVNKNIDSSMRKIDYEKMRKEIEKSMEQLKKQLNSKE